MTVADLYGEQIDKPGWATIEFLSGQIERYKVGSHQYIAVGGDGVLCLRLADTTDGVVSIPIKVIKTFSREPV
jgi:hypothetical protein